MPGWSGHRRGHRAPDDRGRPAHDLPAALAPGVVTTPHDHPHEQMTIVEKGRARFTIGDEERVSGRATCCTSPPASGTVRRCSTRRWCLIDIFSPIREDFLRRDRRSERQSLPLEGRVALVTGASRGLGAAMARRAWPRPAPTWPCTAIAIAAETTCRAVEALGPPRDRRSPPTWRDRAASRDRLVADTVAAARPARHPRQQRRDHPPRPDRGVQRRGLARRDRSRPACRVPAVRAPLGGTCWRPGRPARSSTSRRCCRSRAASTCRRMPRRRAAWRQPHQGAGERVGGEAAST